MITMVEFLRARLDEDERDASKAIGDTAPFFRVDGWAWWDEDWGDYHMEGWTPSRIEQPDRMLVEIAAKRQIVDEYTAAETFYGAHSAAPAGELHGLRTALRLLALPYSDHPDYRQEWAQ